MQFLQFFIWIYSIYSFTFALVEIPSPLNITIKAINDEKLQKVGKALTSDKLSRHQKRATIIPPFTSTNFTSY
jgi:hypothetical protein